MEILYTGHYILERAHDLVSKLTEDANAEKANEIFHSFDKLERIIYMRVAENHAGRPQPNGIYEWSPQLENSGRRVTYWKLQLNCRTDTTSPMAQLKKELKIIDNGIQIKAYIQQTSLKHERISEKYRRPHIKHVMVIWRFLTITMLIHAIPLELKRCKISP